MTHSGRSMGKGRKLTALIGVGVVGLVLCGKASADVVFEQVSNQRGGFISDTDAVYFGQEHYWERMADDFQLQEDAALTNVVFFGFYYDAFYAPAQETIRVRFLGARSSDGLPDESAVLYSETFQNPSREATGEIIIAGPGPPEYKYTIDLAAPFTVSANTRYWLEIVQLGDPDSDFAWENALTTSPDDRIAGNNANYPNWAYTSARFSLAFQLIVPEPNGLVLIAMSLFLHPRRRGRRRQRARSR